MEWQQLISSKRLGMENYTNAKHDNRTEFQRDYDRLIFSPAFRRLQNKTQVFPLPGSIFVHNRLTHSLEVACVGRSLGNAVTRIMRNTHSNHLPDCLWDIDSIVAAACLAHDLGNPPFGHSGETAIATFFNEGNGMKYKDLIESIGGCWSDFTHFDGNANALRLLAHRFCGRREGGFALTYSTLASIVKYPYASEQAPKNKNKFGFFTTEKAIYQRIANELGIIKIDEEKEIYARHPLVYLVEAADDICYQVMDLEDAFKLRIVSLQQVHDLLMPFLTAERQQRAKDVFNHISDTNEQIAYLRSTVIGTLVDHCATVFVEHEQEILAGTFKGSLINSLPQYLIEAYRHCSDFAITHIYRSKEVLDVELPGYTIITELLDGFTTAVYSNQKVYSKQLLQRIPKQYNTQADSLYERLQAVVDYVSGMTDVYALDLYKLIHGISLVRI